MTFFLLLALAAAAAAPPSPLEQGQRAFHVQDWPAAERWFVEAARQAPGAKTAAAAHKWLGMTYAAQPGKVALAEAPLRRACELDANEPEACYYLGRTLLALGRPREAVVALQQAPAAESARVKAVLAQAEAQAAGAQAPQERLNQHRVTSKRSPAPELGAERLPIPSLVDGVVDRRDWEKRKRPELVRTWTEILGKLEPAPQERRWFGDIRAARILDTQEKPTYTRIHLELPIERDFYQPHLLLVPKGGNSQRRPAVICWTSTTPDYTAPEQWWGAWLAERGYVVLTSWSFIRNYRGGSTYASGAADQLRERFGRWAPIAKMVHDARREAEFLKSRRDVDPQRIGFIGFSLGAKAAVYVGAFAPEIAATVALDPHIAVNGGTNWYAPWYLDWTRPWPELGGRTALSLLNPDPARPGFEHDHHELLALAAPRPFLLIGGSQSEDTGGDSDDLQSWGYVNRAREVYRLLGVPDRLQFASTGDGHKPNGPSIDPAWQGFFERWLGRRTGSVK